MRVLRIWLVAKWGTGTPITGARRLTSGVRVAVILEQLFFYFFDFPGSS